MSHPPQRPTPTNPDDSSQWNSWTEQIDSRYTLQTYILVPYPYQLPASVSPITWESRCHKHFPFIVLEYKRIRQIRKIEHRPRMSRIIRSVSKSNTQKRQQSSQYRYSNVWKQTRYVQMGHSPIFFNDAISVSQDQTTKNHRRHDRLPHRRFHAPSFVAIQIEYKTFFGWYRSNAQGIREDWAYRLRI